MNDDTNFHLDEMIWRDEMRQHEQAMTWLTAIPSEDEFERMVMLVRWGRYLSGNVGTSLKNWESRRLRVCMDKRFVSAGFFLLRVFDRLVSLAKVFGFFRERPLFGRKRW